MGFGAKPQLNALRQGWLFILSYPDHVLIIKKRVAQSNSLFLKFISRLKGKPGTLARLRDRDY